jgi:hypothetical protein
MSNSGQIFLAALIGTPLSILVHELGHAMVGLRFTTGPVAVRVGQSRLRAHLKLGRLTVIVSPFAANGVCRARGRFARRPALAFILAGVGANLLIAVVVGGLAMADDQLTVGPAMFTFAAINAVGIFNLVPSYAPTTGQPLDGLRALRLLQRRPQPTPIAARGGGLNRDLSTKEAILIIPVGVLGGMLVLAFPIARFALWALLPHAFLGQIGVRRSKTSPKTSQSVD